jgi:hypothetical protein
MGQLKQIALAVDQLGNTLIGGWADETISSRSWRMSSTSPWWHAAQRCIDAVALYVFGQADHCFESWMSERLRSQAPPELRLIFAPKN